MSIGKCEAKVGGKRPSVLRNCNAVPAAMFTIYRDDEPYSQVWRCADHEPGFSPTSHFIAHRGSTK